MKLVDYDFAEAEKRLFEFKRQADVANKAVARMNFEFKQKGREIVRNYPIIDSIGLEVETEQMVQGNLPHNLRDNWHEDHDASIESYAYQKNGLVFKNQQPNSRKVKLGSEIVSGVLDSTNERSELAIKQLLNWIAENGESEESFRAGVHVHVCMPNKLTIQKNLINICAYLEQLFFYIGGMGYEHRGIENNFTYCRPITQYGPSCVKYERMACQCFTIESLLNSKNNIEFWDAYGGINQENPPNKYIPQRYTWFTLYPLLTKGTVEFRIFNKSLNFYYIKAAINLCKAVCELSLRGEYNFPENSIYTKHSKNDVFKVLNEFSGLVNLDSDTYNTLSKMINRTPDMVVKPEYYWSHLLYTKYNKLETLNWKEFVPNKIKRDSILTPKFVDIHNLEENDRPAIEDNQDMHRIQFLRNDMPMEMPEFIKQDVPDIWNELNDIREVKKGRKRVAIPVENIEEKELIFDEDDN